MVAVDTSVLAYAANRYAPEHLRAARALEELVNGDQPWALPWTVAHEFLGLVTHPHAVVRPLEPREAWAFVERLMTSPSVRMLSPGTGHAAAVAELLEAAGPAGGLTPGLETAAILREHGIRELLSADRGMRRFSFLTVLDPVHGEGWSPEARPLRRYRVLRARVR